MKTCKTESMPAQRNAARLRGRRRLLWLALFFCTGFAADNQRAKRKHECAAIDRRIDRIRSQRRAGYTAKQGRKSKARLRELQQQRFTRCR